MGGRAVLYEHRGDITVITVNRPERRNAVDGPTATLLADAVRDFEADSSSPVAILTGAGGTFCSGADLKALAAGDDRPLAPDGDGPMGPTRIATAKPVIAAVEGFAVAGGLELAIWCDLRVAASNSVWGVLSRRFGVPLIDLGTVRLPRLIGHSRAADLIITGRQITGEEAHALGLVNLVTEPGRALEEAVELARTIAGFPQNALRNDLASMKRQWGVAEDAAGRAEFELGMKTIAAGETAEGARRFAGGAGRHGQPDVGPEA